MEETMENPLRNGHEQPLLSRVNEREDPDCFEKRNTLSLLFSSLLKWVLKIVMWMLFIAWVFLIFIYPLHSVDTMIGNWIKASNETFLSFSGASFMIFSGPVFAIGILSSMYLMVTKEDEKILPRRKTWKYMKFNLWTFPVLVQGALGVVSAAELLGILLLGGYLLWSTFVFAKRNISTMLVAGLDSFAAKCSFMVELTGIGFGSTGIFCLSFLFLPIARGSVLLRLVDIPFEHAARYHIWLGHITMLVFTLHGFCYLVAWTIAGELLQKISAWNDVGYANLAGVIALLTGSVMWVTSLRPVRRQKFELFFYTHQLYMVFVLFLALHVGPIVFSKAAGGIILFMLDRFLRFWQSRTPVKVISVAYLPCGVIKIVLSKPASLVYNALSFVFLKVGESSLLQWHPFSVSSSPLDGDFHLSILVKVQGEWTAKLKEIVLKNHPLISASVEGPYGHELPYYLTYERLILVAGGIGISPFLAILSDILHRIKHQKPCLPRDILIVWAIKRSNELSLFTTMNIDSFHPTFSNDLNLEMLVYVTRESEPPLEGIVHDVTESLVSVSPISNGHSISDLVGGGIKLWPGIYTISSSIGFLILLVLLNIFYINPLGIPIGWYAGFLLLVTMAASVLIFGGTVIGLWHLWGRSSSEKEKSNEGKFSNDILRPIEYFI